ncbi:MAG: HWE histidine kinase domain-containing protein [Acetobacteraceae bacterium]
MDSSPAATVAVGCTFARMGSVARFLVGLPVDLASPIILVFQEEPAPADAAFLSERISRWSKRIVATATDGAELESRVVHLALPGELVTVERGRLRVRPMQGGRTSSPIDMLAVSLAVDQLAAAILVLLEGLGQAGTLGSAATRQFGGKIYAARTGSRGDTERAGVEVVTAAETIPARIAAHLARVARTGPAGEESADIATASRYETPRRTATRPSRGSVLASAANRNLATTRLHALASRIAHRHAPAFVVVDANFEVLHASGRVERYLDPAADAGSPHLLRLMRGELRPDLSVVLHHALATGRPSRVNHVGISLDGILTKLNLLAEPMPSRADQALRLIVLFQEAAEPGRPADAVSAQPDGFPGADETPERLRIIAHSAPAFLFITSSDRGWEYVTAPFYALTGMSRGAAIGHGWTDCLHPEDVVEHRLQWQEAAERADVFEEDVRIRLADGSWRWFMLRARPDLDAAGRVIRWVGACSDIDERRRAETHQGRMLAEVQRRVRNILAVVRSVITRTIDTSTTLDDFAAHVTGRIDALARAQGIRARTADGVVNLEDMVQDELIAHGGQDGRQVDVQGPPVLLGDRVAEALALAMHELTTNALKFGALSCPTGRIRIRWAISDADPASHRTRRLLIDWQESGVPVTDLAPTHSGFGRELIERALPYDLQAVTSLSFEAGGLRCTIALPLAEPQDGGTSVEGYI